MLRVFPSRISHPWAPALSSAGVSNLSWSLESLTQSGYLLTIRYHNKDIIKILNEFTIILNMHICIFQGIAECATACGAKVAVALLI